jgi:hypothetical protein
MNSTDSARPKRSWPLIALGTTSFIPGFGFFLGAVAVTWGLLTDRPRARVAIALGATGALLHVLAVATIAWRMRDTPVIREAQALVVTNDLNTLVLALDDYRAKHERYPPTLPDLVGRPIPVRFINIHDQSGGLLAQRLYEYRPSKDGDSFDLFALGPDGQAGTEDDLRPSLPDSVLARSGYRPSP